MTLAHFIITIAMSGAITYYFIQWVIIEFNKREVEYKRLNDTFDEILDMFDEEDTE